MSVCGKERKNNVIARNAEMNAGASRAFLIPRDEAIQLIPSLRG